MRYHTGDEKKYIGSLKKKLCNFYNNDKWTCKQMKGKLILGWFFLDKPANNNFDIIAFTKLS